ncbi:hypothetical protein BU15DRAFT_74104 [Melanogaster broomeanus]|nr:hypothetical protein BU15DRAFT_74104 [Melanogaster broomeanus]
MPDEALARELTLVGIEDPLREHVREAVADCQKAGVAVKLQVLARSSPEDKKILATRPG